MFLLLLGLALWMLAHLFKRVAPARRAALGDPGKGLVAAGIGIGVVLMVLGYRAMDYIPLWTAPSWGVGVNNFLMFLAIALFGAGSSKGRARSLFRHPMLMGLTTWAVAHLLVNGDLASLLLFGGLGLWAIATILIINTKEPAWTRPEPGPILGDIKLFVITTVLYVIITLIHSWIGPSPFA